MKESRVNDVKDLSILVVDSFSGESLVSNLHLFGYKNVDLKQFGKDLFVETCVDYHLVLATANLAHDAEVPSPSIFDLCKDIRAEYDNIPVGIIGTSSAPIHEYNFLAAGADAFVKKTDLVTGSDSHAYKLIEAIARKYGFI